MRADNDNKKQLDHPETAVIYNKFFLYRTDLIFNILCNLSKAYLFKAVIIDTSLIDNIY